MTSNTAAVASILRHRGRWAAARRALRSPRLIVGELVVLALAGVALATVPQVSGGRAALIAFQDRWPLLAAAAGALQLDAVLRSWWFAALVALCAASLVAVQVDQWRHLLAAWRAPLTEASFRAAPYRREGVRPATGRAPSCVIGTQGRLALLGSPLFHLGLLLLALAGVARAALGADAQVDLVEGQTLAPAPEAFGAQWHGPLAAPFSLDRPVTFERLEPRRHPSGALEALTSRFRVGGDAAAPAVDVAVNRPLALGSTRLHAHPLHGPAALLALERGGRTEYQPVLLERASRDGLQRGLAVFPGPLEVHLAGPVGRGAELPGALEVRVVSRGALLHLGALPDGGAAALPGGARLTLDGVRWWARFEGSRDSFLWMAWLGIALIAGGAFLLVALVRVDTAVVLTPAAGGERVLVALRVQRFAPLFADRFEALVRRELGPVAPGNGR